MLSALLVALFQAAAGEPVIAPPGEPAPATIEAAPAEAQTAQNTPAPLRNADGVRRCRTETLTASRVRRATICRTQEEDDETARGAYRAMQDAGAHGGPGDRAGN